MCCVSRLARLTLAQGGLSSSYNVRFVRLYNTSTSEATWFIIEIVMYGFAALLLLFEMYKFWFLRSRHYLKFRSWISIINYLSVASAPSDAHGVLAKEAAASSESVDGAAERRKAHVVAASAATHKRAASMFSSARSHVPVTTGVAATRAGVKKEATSAASGADTKLRVAERTRLASVER